MCGMAAWGWGAGVRRHTARLKQPPATWLPIVRGSFLVFGALLLRRVRCMALSSSLICVARAPPWCMAPSSSLLCSSFLLDAWLVLLLGAWLVLLPPLNPKP
eukprot:326831-Chlamydomonas_euryale.AAC.1